MIETHLTPNNMTTSETMTMQQVIKFVVNSGDTNEIDNLINQLKSHHYDVFGEQVSYYEMFKKYFPKKYQK
jgi:hypothetical protein